MTSQHPSEENFTRGFYRIPDDEKIREMSFAELASELASSEKGSPKFTVFDREIKRHFAKDQAKINQKNIIFGVIIGGVFTIIGALIGGYISTCPPCQQITPTDTVQETKNSGFDTKPKSTDISSKNPSAHKPVNEPAPKENYEQTRNYRPPHMT